MLPSNKRLPKKQFDEVMRSGRVAHSPLFLVRFTIGSPDTRISAVAPKKTAKLAVGRNKMRRLTYEAVQAIFANIKPGTKAIIFAKEATKEKKLAELSSDLKKLFVKVGLMK